MNDPKTSEDDVLRRMLNTRPKPHAKPKESTPPPTAMTVMVKDNGYGGRKSG